MKFTAAADAPYAPVNDEVNAQTFVAQKRDGGGGTRVHAVGKRSASARR